AELVAGQLRRGGRLDEGAQSRGRDSGQEAAPRDAVFGRAARIRAPHGSSPPRSMVEAKLPGRQQGPGETLQRGGWVPRAPGRATGRLAALVGIGQAGQHTEVKL